MLKRLSLVGLPLTLVMMLVFAFSLIGVQAQDATATPEPLPSPTAAIAEMGTGGTHISFWNGLTGSDGVTLNAMLAQFVEENPDLSVTTEIVDWNTLYQKLQTAFVAGTPPDMFLLHAAEIPQFASLGLLMDLSGWYDAAGGALPVADLAESTYNGMVYNGVPYGIPLDNHGRGLWLNLGLFETAGVDPEAAPPTDFEGWVALLQQLTLDVNGNNAASPDFDPENVAQWGTALGEWGYVDFLSLMWQYGGSTLSEDGTTATLNSEAGVAALQNMIDLIYTYHVSPPQAGFDAWQSWAGGNVAIVPSGTWFRNFAVDQTDIEWTTWPQFQFGPEPATWFGAHTFMVPVTAQGEQLAAVQRLIEWVSEHQVDWAASGQVPARISAQEALDAETYPSNIILGETFQQYGHTEIQSPSVLEIQAAIDPEILAALNGQKSAQQALDDAAARVQTILDRTSGG